MVRNIFAPDEVLKLAIEIEENGRAFYKSMADNVKDDKLRQTMNFLGDEEEKHRKIFEEILNGLEETEIVEVYSGEYKAYMQALAGECIFTQELVKSKTEQGFENMSDLLDFALRIEKDSIILYTQMKENVLRNQSVLNKVIEEERKHFILISELKQQYK